MERATTAEELQFPAQGASHLLAGSLFVPEGRPRASVLLASAMGVRRGFYAAFASHLRDAGFAVLTFDYRGIGGSAPKSLRGLDATVHGWAEEDLPGALAVLEARFPGVPVCYVGHSVGGQLLGMMPGAERIHAAFLVAAQVGYWRLWPGMGRVAMWLLWHAGIPLFTRVLGYFPMGRVGMGEDLPAGVAQEWARWGRHPEYLFGFLEQRPAARYDRFQRPLLAYALADDGYAPVPTVEALFERYHSEDKRLRVLQPSEAGVSALGHFGFFRTRAREALWTEPTQWLIDRGSASAGARLTSA